MKTLWIISLFLLLSLIPFPAWAVDFDKGWAAYNNGDYVTALKEWTPLAEQGDAYAQNNLGNMYADGRGVLQDDQTAVEWVTRAAEQGNARAQFNLGNMYYKGEGVVQNYIYAHMWWNIAASSGNEVASKNREIVAGEMTSANISAAQKRARDCVASNYKAC